MYLSKESVIHYNYDSLDGYVNMLALVRRIMMDTVRSRECRAPSIVLQKFKDRERSTGKGNGGVY